jgi:hypothetical protein
MYYRFHPKQTPSGLIPPQGPSVTPDTEGQDAAPAAEPVKPEVRQEAPPSEPVPSREDILQETIAYLLNADPFDNKQLPFILALRHGISREEATEIVYEAFQVLISEGKLEDPEKLAAEQAAKLAAELEDELGETDVDDKDVTKLRSLFTRLLSAIKGRR